MPAAKAYYRVKEIRWMHNKKTKVLVLERIERPIDPREKT